MNHYLPTQPLRWLFCALGALLGAAAIAVAAADEDYELMTRGPVHEAFASTVSYNPEAGILIRVEPPALIDEVAPDQRPEGDNVAWIPGYWAWDDDTDNFLWISGVWRNLPPGREWVPGYWNPVEGQYQWISGYWSDTTEAEVAYLPPPPQSLERGPSAPAPVSTHIWLPGSWEWQNQSYAWRTGYWAAPRQNWVYIPDHYIWTPRGHIYVAGYWDYAVPQRGLVFAPVYFHRPVYRNVGYHYSPSLVISINLVVDNLFLRPRYHHYYFGDYYAPAYRDRGYYSSYSWHGSRRGYDPIYAHQRWSHRQDRHWERDHRARYERLREHENRRPARTWAAMQRQPDFRKNHRHDAALLRDYAERRDDDRTRPKMRPVEKEMRERVARQNQSLRDFASQRRRAESDRSHPEMPTKAREVRRKSDRSPIASRERSDEPIARGKRGEIGDRSDLNAVRENARRKGEEARPQGREPRVTGDTSDAQEQAKPSRERRAEAVRRLREDAKNPSELLRRKPNSREPQTERSEKKGSPQEPRVIPRDREDQGEAQRVQPPKREARPQPQRVQPSKREARPQPQRVQPPTREARPQPQRVQPPTREARPQPQRVEPPKREARPQPQRVQPPTREARPQPQRVQPPTREARPQPQRVQPPTREARPQPQRVQPPTREARPQPQRVQPPKREARPQPQRVQQREARPERVQPQRIPPQRVQPQRVQPQRVQPQRVQPQRVQPQRVQPQRSPSPRSGQRGELEDA